MVVVSIGNETSPEANWNRQADRRTDGQTCVLGGCASKNGAWTDAVLVQILYNLTGTWGNDLCNICCVYANIFLPLTQFCKYISLVEEKDDTGIKEHFAVGNHVEQLENKEDKKKRVFVIIGF